MSHSYVIRPSAETTTPSFPTIARSSSTNSSLTAMTARECTPTERIVASDADDQASRFRRGGEPKPPLSRAGFAGAILSWGEPAAGTPSGVREASAGGEAPSELYLPGIPGRQQLRDVARTALGERAPLLLEHEVLVDRRRDGLQHTDRHRKVGREEIGQQLGGVDVLLVVDPESTL